MSDDQTARSLDAAPWDEPRGPRAPDAFRRIPLLAWVFLALSAARLWVLVDTARLGPAPDPLLVGNVVTDAVGSLAVLLIPAALFIRYPDSPRRAPILTVGVALVAVGELLQALGPGLQPFFESMTIESELAPVPPTYLAYLALASLVPLIGLAGIGLGLDRARRFPSREGGAWTATILLFAAVLIVGRLVVLMRYLPGATDSIAFALYLWAANGIGIGTILAWAYLTIVTVRGARAGEQPASGWGLGVMAGVTALLAYVLFDAMSAVVVPSGNPNAMLFLASGLFAVGPASLFLAVATGLPSLDPEAAIAAG